MNITSKQNRYYDVHYFFCTLIYKGFLPELMTEQSVPIEVKNFINWVIPKKYRPNTQNCPELIKKMLIDKNLPNDIRNGIKNLINKYSPKELTYKEFIFKVLDDADISQNLKHFFKNLPDEYIQRVNERCRLLVDDELFLPSDLLDHDFFSVFH
jgi:hypothetical protein